MNTPKLEIGCKVQVGSSAANLKRGTIHFIGETHFAAGEWIGVVLNEKEGKNDGSLGDIRYFQCQPEYGIFVRRVSYMYAIFFITSRSSSQLSSDSLHYSHNYPIILCMIFIEPCQN